MKKGIEKVKDDLYVKKLKHGYRIVYPPKHEDGTPNKGSLKTMIIREFVDSLPMLSTIILIVLMLLPGAHQVKVECEEAIEYLQENSCRICNNYATGQTYGLNNISVLIDSPGE